MDVNPEVVKGNKLTWCLECGEDPALTRLGLLHKDNKEDVKLVQEYCENSTGKDSICEPVWHKCCGYLKMYLITLIDSKEKRGK